MFCLILDPFQVVVEQMPAVGREKLAQVAADAGAGLVAERVRRGGIDRENRAGEIVRADQSEAALHELAVAALALAQRLGRLVPGDGEALDRDRVALCHGSGRMAD